MFCLINSIHNSVSVRLIFYHRLSLFKGVYSRQKRWNLRVAFCTVQSKEHRKDYGAMMRRDNPRSQTCLLVILLAFLRLHSGRGANIIAVNNCSSYFSGDSSSDLDIFSKTSIRYKAYLQLNRLNLSSIFIKGLFYQKQWLENLWYFKARSSYEAICVSWGHFCKKI